MDVPFTFLGDLHVEDAGQSEGQEGAAGSAYQGHQCGEVGDAQHNDTSQ